jgi:hypothetical protein
MRYNGIKAPEFSEDVPLDPVVYSDTFLPRLLNGETCQAFLTVSYEQPRQNIRHINSEPFTLLRLRSLM